MKSLKFVLAGLLSSVCVLAGAQTNSNLSIDLSVAEASITAGDSVTINIALENSGSFIDVATNPIVTVQMPAGSGDFTSADCMQISQLALQCELAEIGVEENTGISLSAVLNNAGNQLITAIIEADNLLGGSAADSKLLTVLPQTEITDPVDLVVTASANGDNEISAIGLGYITAVVRNTDLTNTAYFPEVELVISESLEFYSGSYCTTTDETVNCRLPVLAPQSETELIFAVTGIELGPDAVVSVIASSTQPEAQVGDNEASVTFEVVAREILCGASNPQCTIDGAGNTGNPVGANETVDELVEQTDEPSTGAANSSGGGAMSMKLLLWLLLCLCGTLICQRNSAKSIKVSL